MTKLVDNEKAELRAAVQNLRRAQNEAQNERSRLMAEQHVRAELADENAELRAAFQGLKSEINRLRAQDERWQAMIERQAELVGKSKQEAAHLRGLLRQVEWIRDVDGWLVCPVCNSTRDTWGHIDGCDLAAALEGDE